MEQVIRIMVAQRRQFSKSLSDFKIRDEQAMRVLILALSVLGIFVSADAAKAGPSTTTRELSASADPAMSDRRSNPGNRRPDRPRQAKASRRAAPVDRSRLRHQGQRQVRQVDPRRHHCAGRRRATIPPPASSTRPTSGAAERVRLDGAGQRQRKTAETVRPVAAAPAITAVGRSDRRDRRRGGRRGWRSVRPPLMCHPLHGLRVGRRITRCNAPDTPK